MSADAIGGTDDCRPRRSNFRYIAVALGLTTCANTFASSHAMAQCAPVGPYNNGADTVVCAPGTGENIDTLGGADRVTVNGGNVTSIVEGTGNDRLTANGGTIGAVDQGSGNDTAVVNGGTITGTLDQGSGQDVYRQTGGNVNIVDQGSSGDRATIQAGAILGTILQGSGNDRLTVDGGTITQIDQGSFNDRLVIRGGTIATVDTGTGRDNTTISAGTVTGVFQQNDGTDTFTMTGGLLGSLDQGGDFDRATISGGRIIGQFSDGDNVRFSGGQIGSINLTAGNNVFRMSGSATVDTFVNSEQGRDRYFLSGGSIGTFVNTGSENDTLVLDGTAVGSFIDFETGNDRITLNSGSVGGNILMGVGSDRSTINATFASAGLGGILDGGDDLLTTDGQTDILTFANWTDSIAGSKLVNWERIVVNRGAVALTGNSLVTGQELRGNGRALSGVTVTNGGQLELGTPFVLTGNATLVRGGSLVASTAGGTGDFTINGVLDNRGVVNFSGASPAAGDRLTVTGNYFGGGAINFDSNLDASEVSDQLIINGRVRGRATTVNVNDTGSGLGAPTGSGPGDGIKIIDVSNTGLTTNTNFVLNGELKTGGISGAYVYNLFLETDGNWYLQSVYMPDPAGPAPKPNQQPATPSKPKPQPKLVARFAPTVATYEVYPHLLFGLNSLPTYRQRVGDRHRARPLSQTPCDDPLREPPCQIATENDEHSPQASMPGRATWAKMTLGHRHSEQASSTTLAAFSSDSWKLEGGADFVFGMDDTVGRLIGGVSVHYGGASGDVGSPFGNGEIDAAGGGFGLTGTFVGNGGFYLDGQARVTWSSSDLGADLVGEVADGNRGVGFSIGIEAGQQLNMAQGISLIPQAQLTFRTVDFDTFTDRFNGTVSLVEADSLEGRVGFSIENQTHWRTGAGSVSQQKLYAIANLRNEFLGGTQVEVSGVGFSSQVERLWGEIALGGSMTWADGAYSIHGEIGAQTSLKEFGESYGATGKAGVTVRY